MAIDQSVARPRRSSGWRVMLPTLVALVLALAWSGFWWYASREAEGRITAFLAEQAAEGRELTCSERSMGGFPFRLELRCADPKLVVSTGDAFTATAGALTLVAQVYRPNHVIAELAGPLAVVPADGGPPVEAEWSSARGSVVFPLSGGRRASVVVEDLSASAGADQPLVTGGRLEAHVRSAESEAASPGSYDVALQLSAPQVPPADVVLGGQAPLRLELQGMVTGVDALAALPAEERLRAWAAAGGAVDIALARIDRGPSSAKAEGRLTLDRTGRPEGAVTVTVAGIDELSASLKQAGVAPPNVANLLGVGLALLGKPSAIDGRPAIEVPVTLDEGQARVGAFSAGAVPSLF